MSWKSPSRLMRISQSRHSGRVSLMAWLLVPTLACAHAGLGRNDAPDPRQSRRKYRALVLPILWVPEPSRRAAALDAAVLQRWRDADVVEVVPGLRPVEAACADDLSCLQRLGREANTEKVMLYRVGRLGPTTIVRVQSIDVDVAAMEQTLQEILEEHSRSDVDEALLEATSRLAAFYDEPAPWYFQSVTWISAAAAVVAGVLGFFLLRDDGDPRPDQVVVPPAPR